MIVSLNKTCCQDQLSRKQEQFTWKLVFTDVSGGYLPPKYKKWTNIQLKLVRYYLTEFVVQYKSVRQSSLKPSSMKTYRVNKRGLEVVEDDNGRKRARTTSNLGVENGMNVLSNIKTISNSTINISFTLPKDGNVEEK